MLNPISAAFKKARAENRPALLTYTVAGDSSKKQSLDILKSISKNADILEVGVPHNTPVADGSQIQTSAYRAIKKGIKINDIFKFVRDFKKFDKNKPIMLAELIIDFIEAKIDVADMHPDILIIWAYLKSKNGDKKEAGDYWKRATNTGFELEKRRWVSQLPNDLKKDLENTLTTVSNLY